MKNYLYLKLFQHHEKLYNNPIDLILKSREILWRPLKLISFSEDVFTSLLRWENKDDTFVIEDLVVVEK